MSNEVKIILSRTFVFDGFKKLSQEQKEQISTIGYEDDEDLSNENYVFVVLEFERKEYTLIHGFPGDNPCGGFFDKDQNVIIEIGDGACDPDDHPISKWYEKIHHSSMVGRI
uniref:Uncharacterized protein n=1 Tax=Pithovirus LCPAC403 TaxID=2506596 RepID=A0A481ZCN9_9VIRU|nr:MAG: uncharacterized protein LCPAC403_02360 [Pithovirus LCPAC403]